MSKMLISLTPAESKRLIAKAAAAMPAMRNALRDGVIIISRGSTTAKLVQELLPDWDEQDAFIGGWISPEGLTRIPKERRAPDVILEKGRHVDISAQEALERLGPGDIFIKGGNAVDAEGNVGVLVHSNTGGSSGKAIGTLYARGSTVIIPISLEKFVPSVLQSVRRLGNQRFEYVTGDAVGMIPVVNAIAITEVKALEILASVKACHVAGGGIAGAEGSILLEAEGEDSAVKKLFTLVSSIKGEPPVLRPLSGKTGNRRPLGA